MHNPAINRTSTSAALQGKPPLKWNVSRTATKSDQAMSLDTHQSVYREQLLEHLLVGEFLKLSWLKYGATLEVSNPSIDRAGHDIVLEANGVTRHVQLKSSAVEASAAGQKIHIGLSAKPSGCVVWTCFNRENLKLGPFLFFGGLPGEPLPSLETFKIAKHTKANSLGIKAERPNMRVIQKSRFQRIETIEELYKALFGSQPCIGRPACGEDEEETLKISDSHQLMAANG